MTAFQFTEYILKHHWSEDGVYYANDGSKLDVTINRDEPVPYPHVIRESSEQHKRMDPSREDYIVLKDGGITEIEGRSVGGTEQRQVSLVNLELRTTGEGGKVPGRERLWGYRDSSNDAEDYGGLAGETLRVIEELDWREKEFDVVQAKEANDLSGQYGGGVWVGIIHLVLDARATKRYPYT